MKHGWEYKKLGEICQIVTGSTPKTSVQEYWGGKYPWVTPAELKGDVFIDDTERHITDEAVAHTNVTLLPIGTVLLSSRAPIGKVAITTREMYCNQGFKNLICSDTIFNKYLYFWLKGKTDYLNSLGRGATFKEISKSIVENIQIPLPPIQSQQYIVSELDKINELICLKKEQLKDYDNLVQSIFYEMFGDPVVNEKGWEKKRLGEVCSEIKYGTSKPACDNGKYKYLRMCNLSYDGYLDLTDIKRIDVSDEEIEKCIVRYGDILFNRTNSHELIGKTCMFDQQEPMVIDGYIIRVRLTKELMPQVFARMFNLASIKKLLRSMAKGAVNQANINSKELASIQIPIPSLDLQQHFVKRIELIEQQKAEIQSTIADLETLLASRMQYWFD